MNVFKKKYWPDLLFLSHGHSVGTRKNTRRCLIITCAMLVTACGGGGSDSAPSPTTYNIGGSVNSLSNPGLVLFDGTNKVSISATATSFSFQTPYLNGAPYSVNIFSQPPGFTDVCALSNAFGTVGSANITDITVMCHAAIADVTTFAGSGTPGEKDGVGKAASFDGPAGVAIDASGNVYVAEVAIRKITPVGVVTTFANGPTFGAPVGVDYASGGVAVDSLGNVYVGDLSNSVIRKITPAGVATTFAGSGFVGQTDGTGTAASFSAPAGIAVDGFGNLYVADSGNNVIRKITSAGVVTTLAGSGSVGSTDGTGTAASFFQPIGVALDSLGNVYVADYGNGLIRKITQAGVVTRFAGTGKRDGAVDSFEGPTGVAVDSVGNVYVADVSALISKITPAGLVTKLAGGGGPLNGTDGVGAAANFGRPYGIAIDSQGNLYVADFGYNTIRKILPL